MSDRIDELLADAAVAIHNNDRHVLLKVITDIATIAREAEAEVSVKSTVGHEVADAWQTEADNWKARALEAEEQLAKYEAGFVTLAAFDQAIKERDTWGAMCELLAGLWAATDECPISIGGLDIEFECDDDPPCIPPIDEQRIARCWLAAAREEVEQDET